MQITNALVLLTVISYQATPSAPIKTGSVAQRLTSQEVSDLEKIVAPSGGKPWLINGDPGQIGGPRIEVYLPPQVENSRLRRGVLVEFSRDVAGSPWKVESRKDYAQVSIVNRAYDSIQGDSDQNRPFQLNGTFPDDELVGLVTFIRGTIGSRLCLCPILALSRPFENLVDVELRGGVMSGQTARLRWDGRQWTIVGVRNWVA